jgi:hypothetical protein
LDSPPAFFLITLYTILFKRKRPFFALIQLVAQELLIARHLKFLSTKISFFTLTCYVVSPIEEFNAKKKKGSACGHHWLTPQWSRNQI